MQLCHVIAWMQLITQATGQVIAPAIANVYIYLFCGCDYSQIVCMRMHMNTAWDCSAVKELQCTIPFTSACCDSKLSRANLRRQYLLEKAKVIKRPNVKCGLDSRTCRLTYRYLQLRIYELWKNLCQTLIDALQKRCWSQKLRECILKVMMWGRGLGTRLRNCR